MIVQRLPYIIFRQYPEYGYLTDNRNFGYDTASKSCLKVGDMLLSFEGSVFYSVLSDAPQNIDSIAATLHKTFAEIPISILSSDALDFYKELHIKGFVFCGEQSEYESYISRYFSYDRHESCVLKITQDKEQNLSYDNVFRNKYSLSRVHIDISSRCDENCIHCYIPAKNKCSIMSEEMFDKVIHQCSEMNVINITMSGGEPMLNPHIDKFITKCVENNFSVNILSNLTLLTDKLLNIIASNPLISVQTSLYAMDADVHNSITRNPSSFSKTLESIKKLYEKNVPLQINCPIMKQNQHCYNAVLDFATSLNIEASSDYMLYGSYDLSKSNLNCRLSSGEVQNIIEEECSNDGKRQEYIDIAKQKKVEPSDSICSVCKSSLCVANNGDVYPCEGWQNLSLGNLDNNSLSEIWNDSPIVEHLRNLTYQDFPKCNGCENKRYCSTCLIMNSNEDSQSDYKTVNPYMCAIARVKTETVNNQL